MSMGMNMNQGQAPSSTIPRHVFISYAHADSAFADRLVEDLERANIPCWIDRLGLQPGTPDWEQAIREAIADAFAVLLIATPASRQALAVQGELVLASGSACRVIPLWAAGDRWEESVALTLIRTQYVDCRGDRYPDAVTGIITTLQHEWDRLAPRQAVLAHAFPPPAGYVSIALTDGRSVAFRAAAFPTFQALLNTLYLEYLRDTQQPFTYGRDWLLASTIPGEELHVLAVPWEWLRPASRARPLSRLHPNWDAVPLERYGVVAGTAWAVLAPPTAAFGIATNNARFDETLTAFCVGNASKELDLLLVDFLPRVARDRSGQYTSADLVSRVLPADGTEGEVLADCPYRYVLGGTGRNVDRIRQYDGYFLSYHSAGSQAPLAWLEWE